MRTSFRSASRRVAALLSGAMLLAPVFVSSAAADPPPWAHAHGWRSHGRYAYAPTHGYCVVRRTNGTAAVIDGPYAESKELIGGFAMLQYPSREAAIEGARRFMDVAGDGECVTYRLMEQEDC